MPNKRSAAKRQRQNEKRRLSNRAVLTRVRTTMRKLREAVQDQTVTEEHLNAVVSRLDRAVAKGVLKRNTAARRKQLATRLVRSRTSS